jgi:glutamate racemase
MVAAPFCASKSQEAGAVLGDMLGSKDSLTLLITDSGLGGLSVVAGMEQRARDEKAFAHLRLVFFNAQPAEGFGYNKMKSLAEKAGVFDGVLDAMCARYSPDAILIACNTLSVVYPSTRFSRAAAVPVLGIVEMGVDMIEEALVRDSSAAAIIFGTETTIAADAHRQGLLMRGIAPGRIVTQACPDLAGQIEEGATSPRVHESIGGFVKESLARVGSARTPIVAGLCCTHYGFSEGEFRSQLTGSGAASVTVVNPNVRMCGVLFSPNRKNAHPHTGTTVEVVSRVAITPQEQSTIGDLVRPVSPGTATALHTYRHDPDLFPFRRTDN